MMSLDDVHPKEKWRLILNAETFFSGQYWLSRNILISVKTVI